MATTSSRFFAANVRNLLKELGEPTEGELPLDLDNEIVRGALQVHEGAILPPPERPRPTDAPPQPKKTIEPKKAMDKPETKSWHAIVGGALVLAIFTLVALTAPEAFVQRFTVFILACFVGWQVVWSVTAALHTPLMSVTNAISGIILVGGMLQGAQPGLNLATILGAVALFFASINVFGGFLVTQRMLRMFRKGN